MIKSFYTALKLRFQCKINSKEFHLTIVQLNPSVKTKGEGRNEYHFTMICLLLKLT